VVIHLAKFGDHRLNKNKVALDIWDSLQSFFYLSCVTESLNNIFCHHRTMVQSTLNVLIVCLVPILICFFMMSGATLGDVQLALCMSGYKAYIVSWP
jgi:hypothetical protein